MGVRHIHLLAGALLMMGQCSARAPWATKTHLLPTVSKTRTKVNTPTIQSTLSASVPESLAIASVRGGSSALDSISDYFTSNDNISTLFASIAMAEGIFLTFAPEVAFRLDGGSIERDSLAGAVAQVLGSINIGTAVTVVMLTRSQASLAKAVGVGLVPRICVGVTSWLSGKLSRVGFKFDKRLLAGKLVFVGAVLTSLILEKGKPEATMQIIAGVETVIGLASVLFPEMLSKTVDIDLSTEENKQARGLFQLTGQSILSHGVYVGCLVAGCAPTKALGATAATYAAGQIWTVATKAHDDLGISQEPFIGYAIMLASIAGKLLMGDDVDTELVPF